MGGGDHAGFGRLRVELEDLGAREGPERLPANPGDASLWGPQLN